MPTFVFNRLVRDLLPEEFTVMQQQAVYRSLSKVEHLAALKEKILEELKEIPLQDSLEEFEKEVADVQQALDDLVAICGASTERIAQLQHSKLLKKGGFQAGHYVETLTLAEDDPWVAYYRAEPERHKEM
jgi:predicted house-cleaning noncanonical NTP pyrophosphatase (MazG superfamily)